MPHFRFADAADAPALADFMTRNFLAAYGHSSTPDNVRDAVDEHYGLAAQQRQLADPARTHVLAEVDGVLAGYAQLHAGHAAPAQVTVHPAVDLARFYVDIPWHGRGIAQALMAQTERVAIGLGAASLWLSVWQEQPQAVRFYEKAGFARAGTIVFVVGDDPKDDWLMVRRL